MFSPLDLQYTILVGKASTAATEREKGFSLVLLLVFQQQNKKSNKSELDIFRIYILTIGFKDAVVLTSFCCFKRFLMLKISTSITCHSVVIKQSFKAFTLILFFMWCHLRLSHSQSLSSSWRLRDRERFSSTAKKWNDKPSIRWWHYFFLAFEMTLKYATLYGSAWTEL